MVGGFLHCDALIVVIFDPFGKGFEYMGGISCRLILGLGIETVIESSYKYKLSLTLRITFRDPFYKK